MKACVTGICYLHTISLNATLHSFSSTQCVRIIISSRNVQNKSGALHVWMQDGFGVRPKNDAMKS